MQRHAFGLGDRCDPLANQPLHIVEPQQRTGESKAVVGELRHHSAPLRQAVQHALATGWSTGTALSNRSAIASMSLRSITGTFACGNAMSEAIGDDMRIVRVNQRLAVGCAMDFQLGKRVALEAFHQHQIDR